ncbi:peptidoglycan DD-metalloendopeptidase family protein [Streptomyces sp. VNUA116]|uniref:M23 family metallopeptidase n=1 Tax=Streptomyces sp. VNUA116 TaxID=3062449 RepID=UPI002675ACAE|nr:peptidoglycan DD-metalloendopeptidase family protein [Streptomyces sp. VNUA116]WKU45596.1 peptidoglycan DD-metalloendopeptidase family protein [Streptomyces sp. VNUA116]
MASREPATPYELPAPYEPATPYEPAASYEHASYERAPYQDASYEDASYDPPLVPAYAPPYEPDPEPSYEADRPSHERSYEPSAFSAFSFGAGRGRHRVVKQRGGTMARSGAVLGVGVIAAVGAGGMASAQERPASSISMPDLAQLPGVSSFFAGSAAGTADSAGEETGTAASEMAQEAARAGEALRARIMEQADHQQGVAEAEAQAARVRAAAAVQKQAAERKAAEAESARAAEAAAAEQKQARTPQWAQAPAQEQAQTPEKTKAETRAPEKTRVEKQTERRTEKRERPGRASAPAPSRHSGAFTLPVGSYTLTAGFGQAGNMWSAHHTGEDFAAPTGTPVKAVGGGTITQAGWAGAYGYRIVLRLDDGTELWFCHLSSMVVTSGKVAAGQVIGRVGATGNVTGPHLHLEVRPGGGAPTDPLGWLRGRGLQP